MGGLQSHGVVGKNVKSKEYWVLDDPILTYPILSIYFTSSSSFTAFVSAFI